MYTAAGGEGGGGGVLGGKRYLLRGKIFFISPHIIQSLLTFPLLTKRKNDIPHPISPNEENKI